MAFFVFVTWYSQGQPVSEQRIRYYAGAEPAHITQALNFDPRSDTCQVVFYVDRAQRGTLTVQAPEFLAGLEHLFFGQDQHEVEPVDLRKVWRQDGRRAICQSFFGEHYAEMPEGWSLERVHPAALDVAEWVLYNKLETAFFGLPPRTPGRPALGRRDSGPETLLSFSLGTDSTAAATLLPPSTPKYYCRRPYSRYLTTNGAAIELPSHAPYDERLEAFSPIDVVDNTFELIWLAAGQRHGYAHGFGYVAVGLLLADLRNIGEIAFGSVMEQVFLRSGDLYTDIVDRPGSSVNRLSRALGAAGIRLSLPTAGCSEILTAQLAEGGQFAGMAISCPRPDLDGAPCGTCFKCFRKLRMVDPPAAPEPEEAVLKVLQKRPLKSATSVVAACQRSNWWGAGLEQYRDIDLDFLNRYYGHAVSELNSGLTAARVESTLAEFGISPMSEQDEDRLRAVGAVFSPDEYELIQSRI